MKKIIFLSCLFLLILGCSNSISESDIYRFDGISAYASTLVTKEDNSVPTNCPCNGSGKEKSGDGLSQIPCRCGNHCKCKGNDTNSKNVQVWFFTQKNCNPCQKFKKKVLPLLQANGWKVAESGSGQNCHIVIFDLDKNPELIDKYNVGAVPLFIRVVDGKEVQRHEGFLDQSPSQIGSFFNGTFNE